MAEKTLKQGLPNLPDWVEEKLDSEPDIDFQKDVPDRHILKYFLGELEEKAWLTVKQVASDFDMSKEGMRQRLNELHELQILDKETAGGADIFWIHSDQSNWPIPPDTEVEPVPSETTVSELKSTGWIVSMVITGIVAFIGGVLTSSFVVTAVLFPEVPNFTVHGISVLLPGAFLLGGILFSLLSLISAIITIIVYMTTWWKNS